MLSHVNDKTDPALSGGEFGGVREQVGHHLVHPVRVGLYHRRREVQFEIKPGVPKDPGQRVLLHWLLHRPSPPDNARG